MNRPSSRRDVRMRGFVDRSVVEDALAWVDRQTRALDADTVGLYEAHGRVLLDDMKATIDVPPFPRSAMDGYALRGAETTGAGDYNPLAFELLGDSMPGRPFDGCVSAGQAVRIMTGAPIPDGADAVVPAEYANESEGRIEITMAVAPGKHVGLLGEDIARGTRILCAGRRLRPQDVGVLASVGKDHVCVVRRPQVRIVITGDELAAPGQPRGPHQIFDSNSSMLAALIARDGGCVESRVHVQDNFQSIRDVMTAPGAEVVLVSGGSSVGAEDHAPSILAQVGELAIHGIAMRPSSPAGMGTIGETLVFLLPGNPVSCLCAYDFFAGRAIRRLGGRSDDWPYHRRSAVVGKKIVSAVGRVDYCRVRLANEQVEPLALSGASILSSTTRADGFVIIPASSEGYAPGSSVTVYLYESL
jgi:molybdopterin molybdotransferase